MAADTFTALLGLLKQGTGNNNNTWGALQSTGDFDEIDLAIAGRNAISTTGGTTDLSASPPPAGPSGAIHMILDVSGTLASNAIIQVPNLSKIWVVRNTCVLNGHTLTFKTPSGSASPAIPDGRSWIWCDGNNNVLWDLNTSLRDVQWLGADGTLAAPGISFASEPGTGIRRKGTQDVTVVINGADVLEITGAGASSPSIVNVLSPNALQIQGVQVVPPGTEVDYAGITAPTGWLFPVGQAVSRTTDAPLFAAITATATGNTHTSTTLDNLSTDLRTLGLVGAFIEGTGIPTGTTIASINSATSLTLSAAATSSTTGLSIRILPFGQGDASTTFNLPNRAGTVTATRDDLSGTARGLLTKSTTQGIDGTRLNATGGEQAHTLVNGELPVITPTFSGALNSGVANWSGNTTAAGTGSVSVPNANNMSSGYTPAGTISSFGGNQSHNVVQPTSVCNRLIKR